MKHAERPLLAGLALGLAALGLCALAGAAPIDYDTRRAADAAPLR